MRGRNRPRNVDADSIMAEKILIIHNSPEQAGRMKKVLRRDGHQVLTVQGLEKGAQALCWKPEVLLVDLDSMPVEKSDPEQFARICGQTDAPCLVFTSSGNRTAGENLQVPWIQGVIRDCADEQELHSHLRYLLELRRLQNELGQARKMLQRKRAQLDQYLRSAANIQMSLIPARLPQIESLEFSWQFLPCDRVGGDLFNILQLDENTVMIYILDVSGHGISSAMVTVSVFQSLSLHTGQIVKRPLETPPFYRIATPGEVLEELDREYPFERFEEFFTISYLLLDIRTGRLQYSNGGHPPPVLAHADGTIRVLAEGGTIIGLGTEIPFQEGEVVLEPGDRVLLYTDGLIENADAAGEFFGEKRLMRKLAALRREPLHMICRKILESVEVFNGAGHLEDDVTLVGMEYRGLKDGEI